MSNITSKMNINTLVFRIAGTFILLSLLLTHFHSVNWLWFTTFVGANMVQASFTGFCPLAFMLQKLGIASGTAFPLANEQ